MSQPAKAHEPSMEEILASIRRIIADDDSTKTGAKPADLVPPPPMAVAMAPPPPAAQPPVPPSPEPAMRQGDIDAMLSELNAMPPAPREVPAPPPPPAPANDVLELTEAMAAPSPARDGFRTIDGQSDIVFNEQAVESEPEPEPQPEPAPVAFSPPRRQWHEGDNLVSAATSAAVDSAFNTLAQTVLVQNARTLEDLVREMLRPMLKSWLDDNLPGLVERLVRAEIERVSRGRG